MVSLAAWAARAVVAAEPPGSTSQRELRRYRREDRPSRVVTIGVDLTSLTVRPAVTQSGRPAPPPPSRAWVALLALLEICVDYFTDIATGHDVRVMVC
jgi:hypothetical protein